MWSAEAVLVCAFTLLGRSADSFPPIQILTVRPADVSSRAEAFVRRDDPYIYVLATSPNFQRLQRGRDRCGNLDAARHLASVLVHEEVHLRYGGSEANAYEAQLTTLASLGSGSGSAQYDAVFRSMQQSLRPAVGRPRRQFADLKRPAADPP